MAFEIPVILTNRLEHRIAETFKLFDFRSDNCADSVNCGTILQFLGCVPTKAEIVDIIKESEFEPGIIHLGKFLGVLSEYLFVEKMTPAAPDDLLKAFHTLDLDGYGFIPKEEMKKMLMTDGAEPFNEEEITAMFKVAVDPDTDTIPYEYYLNKIIHKPTDSIYADAERAMEEYKSRAIATRLSQKRKSSMRFKKMSLRLKK